MATWTDYKNKVRATNPEIGKDIDEVEAVSQNAGAIIECRPDLNPENSCDGDDLKK